MHLEPGSLNLRRSQTNSTVRMKSVMEHMSVFSADDMEDPIDMCFRMLSFH